MRAAVIFEKGGIPQVVPFEEPAARAGAMILDVMVGAVGPTDLYKAAGVYRPYPGVHVVNGEGMGKTAGGSRVYFGHSIIPFGSWAQRTLVAEEEVWAVPDSVPDDQAAALGVSGTGALVALEQAKIQPGERVLVLGATGVLGQLGLQIARQMGAGTVVAAARNLQMLQQIRERAMADEIVQIGQGDDLAALRAAARGGWNVILDILFGKPGEAALKTSAMGARMVSVSRMASPSIHIDLVDLGVRSISGVGTGIRPAAERKAAFARLMAMAAAGKLRVDVKRFSLDEAPQAWAAQSSSPYCKVLITP
jgi:NADPH:quinone reductase-like Zn-dependent oxidoreductase